MLNYLMFVTASFLFLLQMREITCFYDTSTKWASKPALLHHLTARVLAWHILSKNIRRISN